MFYLICSCSPKIWLCEYLSKWSDWEQAWSSRTLLCRAIPTARITLSSLTNWVYRFLVSNVHSALFSEVSPFQFFSVSPQQWPSKPSQNIIIPLFLHFEALGPSYITAAESPLSWTAAQVFSRNYILRSLFPDHKIQCTEHGMTKKRSYNLGRLIKNMAYVSEQMWEWCNWKWNVARPFRKPFLTRRGNGCSLEGFRNLSSGNCPQIKKNTKKKNQAEHNLIIKFNKK